jgi:hypothetical protein
LLEPIAPFWRVQKIQRVEKDRGLPIAYGKPKWLLEDEKKYAETGIKKKSS